jgi:hypothetical protein
MKLFVSAELLGALAPKDRKGDIQLILSLISDLGKKGIYPLLNKLEDVDFAIRDGYSDQSPWPHQNSSFFMGIYSLLMDQEKTTNSLAVETWNDRSQLNVRIVINGLPSQEESITADYYDIAAKELKKIFIWLHLKLNPIVTVVGYSKKILLAPYNLSKKPLLVDWCSIYSKELQKKYRINDYLPQPKGIILEREGENMIFTCAKPYSEYLETGWDDESKAWWEKLSGKIIYKKLAKRTPRDDGKTFIVEKVDKKTGEVKLKPFKLP